MTAARPDASSTALQARILAGSLMSAIVFLTVAMWFVLGSDDEATAMPSLLLMGLQLLSGTGVHLVLEQVGYRTPALDPALSDEEATRTALARWQSTNTIRFALSEVVVLVSLAGAFVVEEGGLVVYLVGAAVSLALMLVHVWPATRPVDLLAANLERDGKRSGLRQALGVSPA